MLVLAVALAIGWLPAGQAPLATAPAAAATQALDPGCADAPAGRFVDVDGSHQVGIDCIGWWGVTQGVGASRYDPRGSVRRDQMATFLATTLTVTGAPLPVRPPTAFSDTTGNRHAAAIDQLAAAEIIGGVGGGRFAPDRVVRRGQMATFLAAAWAHHTGEPLLPPPAGWLGFRDTTGSIHAANIDRVAAAGIAGGFPDGTFDPDAPVTRAQMGTFLARFIAALVSSGSTSYPPAEPVELPPPPPEPDLSAVSHAMPDDEYLMTSVIVERARYVPSFLALTQRMEEVQQGTQPRFLGLRLFAWDGSSYQLRAAEEFACYGLTDLGFDHGGIVYLGCNPVPHLAPELYAIHPSITGLRVLPSRSQGWAYMRNLERTERADRPDDLHLSAMELNATGCFTGRWSTHTLSWNGRNWEAVRCTNADGSTRRISPPIDARNPRALQVCS